MNNTILIRKFYKEEIRKELDTAKKTDFNDEVPYLTAKYQFLHEIVKIPNFEIPKEVDSLILQATIFDETEKDLITSIKIFSLTEGVESKMKKVLTSNFDIKDNCLFMPIFMEDNKESEYNKYFRALTGLSGLKYVPINESKYIISDIGKNIIEILLVIFSKREVNENMFRNKYINRTFCQIWSGVKYLNLKLEDEPIRIKEKAIPNKVTVGKTVIDGNKELIEGIIKIILHLRTHPAFKKIYEYLQKYAPNKLLKKMFKFSGLKIDIFNWKDLNKTFSNQEINLLKQQNYLPSKSEDIDNLLLMFMRNPKDKSIIDKHNANYSNFQKSAFFELFKTRLNLKRKLARAYKKSNMKFNFKIYCSDQQNKADVCVHPKLFELLCLPNSENLNNTFKKNCIIFCKKNDNFIILPELVLKDLNEKEILSIQNSNIVNEKDLLNSSKVYKNYIDKIKKIEAKEHLKEKAELALMEEELMFKMKRGEEKPETKKK